MGSQFSSGAWLDEVKPLVELDAVYIMSRVYQLDRIIDKDFDDSAFLNKKQIQTVMKLSDRRIFDLFNILDPKKTGKIAKVEFFGAIALASSDIPSEKVGIGFAVADEDEDGYLSQIDLEVLITRDNRGQKKRFLVRNEQGTGRLLALAPGQGHLQAAQDQLDDNLHLTPVTEADVPRIVLQTACRH